MWSSVRRFQDEKLCLFESLTLVICVERSTPRSMRRLRGFVVIDGKSVLPSITLKADQPTDFVGGYSFENAVPITYAINGKKRLAVGFNREADGGIETILPINITPSSNLGAFMDFADC